MDIGFIWDETKYESVIKKHHVTFYEVVSALDDPNGFETIDPNGRGDRWLWVGKTHLDRMLIVVYSDQDLPLYRIITAFEAEGKWKNEYNKERSRI